MASFTSLFKNDIERMQEAIRNGDHAEMEKIIAKGFAITTHEKDFLSMIAQKFDAKALDI